ncbi:hypothetical protein NDU88_005319 [Pleurodeles waltl]|uniref:Uncharacterized protein n=1 Tax=Pleurodeles waltl TaxID=8319 RepID=A0AAV7L0F7_PLEWA|nr:hypothetical protein NDU88_005319 [Pleurodeles waltl]
MYYRDKAAGYLAAGDRTCTTETKLQNPWQQVTEHVEHLTAGDITCTTETKLQNTWLRVTEQAAGHVMYYRDTAAGYLAAGDRTLYYRDKVAKYLAEGDRTEYYRDKAAEHVTAAAIRSEQGKCTERCGTILYVVPQSKLEKGVNKVSGDRAAVYRNRLILG